MESNWKSAGDIAEAIHRMAEANRKHRIKVGDYSRKGPNELVIGLDETHPEVRSMCDAVRKFSKAFVCNDTRNRQVVLCGNTGVGKTHCLHALATWVTTLTWDDVRQFWYGNPNARCVTLADYTQLRRSNPNRASAILTCSLLLLDEVAPSFDKLAAAAEKDALMDLLSKRGTCFNVLATNLHPDQWESVFEPRIASRMVRGGSDVIRVFSAPDRG